MAVLALACNERMLRCIGLLIGPAWRDQTFLMRDSQTIMRQAGCSTEPACLSKPLHNLEIFLVSVCLFHLFFARTRYTGVPQGGLVHTATSVTLIKPVDLSANTPLTAKMDFNPLLLLIVVDSFFLIQFN